jgi:hypothetical protein
MSEAAGGPANWNPCKVDFQENHFLEMLNTEILIQIEEFGVGKACEKMGLTKGEVVRFGTYCRSVWDMLQISHSLDIHYQIRIREGTSGGQRDEFTLSFDSGGGVPQEKLGESEAKRRLIDHLVAVMDRQGIGCDHVTELATLSGVERDLLSAAISTHGLRNVTEDGAGRLPREFSFWRILQIINCVGLEVSFLMRSEEGVYRVERNFRQDLSRDPLNFEKYAGLYSVNMWDRQDLVPVTK